ncbi:MAG: hypothetical protein Q9M91_06605 [Candidatus Dojkabacteria bacterium]|nr:hypothetical protein [Candidatus Dojkabacteria bacterium]MDQ7021467.1 hypothetical protein [Candidatus Dojkabacteria bacterium]
MIDFEPSYDAEAMSEEKDLIESANNEQEHLDIIVSGRKVTIGVFGLEEYSNLGLEEKIDALSKFDKIVYYKPGGAALFNSSAAYAKEIYLEELRDPQNDGKKIAVVSLGHPGQDEMNFNTLLNEKYTQEEVALRFEKCFDMQVEVINKLNNTNQEVIIIGHSIGTLTAIGTSIRLVNQGIKISKVELVMPVGVQVRSFIYDLLPKFTFSAIAKPYLQTIYSLLFTDVGIGFDPNRIAKLTQAGIEAARFNGIAEFEKLLGLGIQVEIYMSDKDIVANRAEFKYLYQAQNKYLNLLLVNMQGAPHHAPNVFPRNFRQAQRNGIQEELKNIKMYEA